MNLLRPALLGLVPLLLQAGVGFDPVKDVSLSMDHGVLSLAVPKGVHLKARQFRVALVSRGTLQLGELPPATDLDEAGDPVWRGLVRVPLHGRELEDPARLVVTYQPCTEGPDGVCFLPVKRPFSASSSEIPGE
jgi:hypothetical protein